MPVAERASANVIIDRADCAGRKTLFGIGRDWIAAEPRRDAENVAIPIAGGAPQWGWDLGDEFEYLPDPVMAIAPKGLWHRQPPDLELWNPYKIAADEYEVWATYQALVTALCEEEPDWEDYAVIAEARARFAAWSGQSIDGYCTRTSGDPGPTDWIREQGMWRLRGITGKGQPPARWLEFFDGRPNLEKDWWGHVRSNFAINPAFIIRFQNEPAHPRERHPLRNGIQFLGQEEGVGYMLRFRGGRGDYGGSDQQDHPTLLHMAWDEDDCEGTVVRELDRFEEWGGQPTGGEASLDIYVVEYTIDGWLVVRKWGEESRWAWRPEGWQPLGRGDDGEVVLEQWLRPGPLRISTLGHKVSFHLEELEYPRYPGVPREYRDCLASTRAAHPSWSDEAIAAHCQGEYEAAHGHPVADDCGLFPLGEMRVPPGFSRAPEYRRIASPLVGMPNSPTVSVVADEVDEFAHRPRVHFQSPSTQERGLLYNVQEHRAAQIGAEVSDPIQTQGNSELRLMSASGTVTSKWRGATASITLRAEPGHVLPTIRSNQQVSVRVKTDDTQGPVTQFVGYVAPEKEKPGGVSQIELTLDCQDAPEKRLRKHKSWYHCSYEGWPLNNDVYPYPSASTTGPHEEYGWPCPSFFAHILNRGGVPDAQIVHHADLRIGRKKAGNWLDYYLPVAGERGQRSLQFGPEVGLVEVLDDCCETRALDWGYASMAMDMSVAYVDAVTRRWAVRDRNVEGCYFVREHIDFVPGVDEIAFVVDEDTVVPDSTVFDFRKAETPEDFYNVLVAQRGSGWGAGAKLLIDWPSMMDPANADFIGEDWWRLTLCDADAIAEMAVHLWRRRRELRNVLYFMFEDLPHLGPDHYGTVDFANMAIDPTHVWRITQKDWGFDDGKYSQTLEIVQVVDRTGEPVVAP